MYKNRIRPLETQPKRPAVRRAGFAAAAVAGWSLLAPGWAAADPEKMTLARALQIASDQNPRLAAGRSHAEAAAARAAGASRSLWPRAALATDWSRSNDPVRVFGEKLDRGEFGVDDFSIDRLNHPAATSHLTTVLSIEAPLDLFGKSSADREASAAAARAAEALAGETREDVRFEVVRAWHEAVLARRAVGAAERAVRWALEREREAESRVDEGAALRADLFRARARRRALESELASRRGDLGTSVAVLTHAVGSPDHSSVEPAESEDVANPEATPQLPLLNWQERARRNRPILHAASEHSNEVAWKERSESLSQLPALGLLGRYQDDRRGFSGGERSGTVAATVRWNLFDPSRAPRSSSASAETRAAREDQRETENLSRLQIETAWQRSRSARERRAAAAGGAEEGREALRVIHERRLAGMATLTDELETEAASFAAELEEIRADTEIAIADAALSRLAGEL